MFSLQCVMQEYEWGKRGKTSMVADLMAHKFDIQEDVPYAELWMGTHPNGPSQVLMAPKGESISLVDFLTQHQLKSALPYLFKVLSVNIALSIQAHPDKKLAKELHSLHPDIYKDSNHKPEMTIALTEFEALCQFRELSEIVQSLNEVPELAHLIQDHDLIQAFQSQPSVDTLQLLFHRFVHCDSEVLAHQFQALLHRLLEQSQRKSNDGNMSCLSPLDALVLRLCRQYPSDIGVFCPYFLNHVLLQPGDSMFLQPNEPHAYLSGDCIECMACSDNVVRMGLTPKLKDQATLCRMLTYQSGSPLVTPGEQRDDHLKVYTPPIQEFQVDCLTLKPCDETYSLYAVSTPSILLVIQGTGSTGQCGETLHRLDKGSVFVQLPGENLLVTCQHEALILFRAHVNESF